MSDYKGPGRAGSNKMIASLLLMALISISVDGADRERESALKAARILPESSFQSLYHHEAHPDCDGWVEDTEFFGALQIPVSLFRSTSSRGSSSGSRYWYHNNCLGPESRKTTNPILGTTFPPTHPPPSTFPTQRPTQEPSATPSSMSAEPSVSSSPTSSVAPSLQPTISLAPTQSSAPSGSTSPSSIVLTLSPSTSDVGIQETQGPTRSDPVMTLGPTVPNTMLPSNSSQTDTGATSEPSPSPDVPNMTGEPTISDTVTTSSPVLGGETVQPAGFNLNTNMTGSPTVTPDESTTLSPTGAPFSEESLGPTPPTDGFSFNEAPTDGFSFNEAEVTDPPGFPNEMGLVYASPFTVVFNVPNELPQLDDFPEASEIILLYLNRFFVHHFKYRSSNTMENFAGEMIGVMNNPPRIGIDVQLEMASDSSLPATDELDSLLAEAFLFPVVQELVDALRQLSDDNPLSSTTSITYRPMSQPFLFGSGHDEVFGYRTKIVNKEPESMSPGMVFLVFLVVFGVVFVSYFGCRRLYCNLRRDRKMRELEIALEEENLMSFRDEENASSTFDSNLYGEINRHTEI